MAMLKACGAVYDERRKYMIKRIRELGFGVAVEPAGAFYILANARHLCNSSYDLAFEILEKADVGVTPGIDFGKNAEGYIRFSYANSIENIREGLNRIRTVFENPWTLNSSKALLRKNSIRHQTGRKSPLPENPMWENQA